MTLTQAMPETEWPESDALSEALERSAALNQKLTPILGLLLTTQDRTLFSDAVIARIRGMLLHIAKHILRVQAEATGTKGAEQFAIDGGDGLVAKLAEKQRLVTHCHALAIETLTTQRLQDLYSLDPVLSPLIQDVIESEDSGLSSAAMGLLAAQARFTQHQRRMELPLNELPADLFFDVIEAWRTSNGAIHSDGLDRAESKLRAQYDEAGTRLALLERVASSATHDFERALDIEYAGVALFLTTLAMKSRLTRQQSALATDASQIAQLVIALRSTGLKTDMCEQIALRMNPDADLPDGFQQIGVREAQSMLPISDTRPGT